MKKTLALLALLLSLALVQSAAAVQLVTNGGFETDDFTGWTVTPAADSSFVFVAGNPHTGNFAAWFGAYGSTPDIISQTLPTVVGTSYKINFWLQAFDDGINSFSASFGGNTLLTLTNQTAFPYTSYSYQVVATGSSTVLSFSGTPLVSFWNLDDVTVTPLPGTLVLLGSGVFGLLAWRKLS
jgi:hypothetical protein